MKKRNIMRCIIGALLLYISPAVASAEADQAATSKQVGTQPTARHSVRPTGRAVFDTKESCEAAIVAGVDSYGPSVAAVRQAEVQNLRAGLVAVFSDADIASARLSGEPTQVCVGEATSVYTTINGRRAAVGRTRPGDWWVPKNMEDLYTRAGVYYDWWCANLLWDFPQPVERSADVVAVSRSNTPVVAIVEAPVIEVRTETPQRVTRRVPVAVDIVYDVTVTERYEQRTVRQPYTIDVASPDFIYREQVAEQCICLDNPGGEVMREVRMNRPWQGLPAGFYCMPDSLALRYHGVSHWTQ